MIDLRGAVRSGHYARKQIGCQDPLISWSHGTRFKIGLALAAELGVGQVVLDHGCGDGTLLGLLQDGPNPPARAVGSEVSELLVEDCRTRLGEDERLKFVLTSELDRPEHRHAYDLIVCMEVLEHVPDLDAEMDRFERLLRPGGHLLISVPVEIGPALIVKQVMRRVAGWRGLGHYPGTSTYSPREFVASVFAGRRQHIARPLFRDGEGRPFHDHKGFNFNVLHDLIAERFRVERVISSPVPWLPARTASQVWFIASKRP